jgi:tRNA (guanine-N7-)-methyltransferase
MLLGKIRTSGVENLRVHPGDVRDLFDVLPEASIAKAFLLYPDPWPKKRHHRRRFVTPEHLEPLVRVLKPGASSGSPPIFPTTCARRWNRCRATGSTWLAEGRRTGGSRGTTGFPPATSRRRCARVACRIT